MSVIKFPVDIYKIVYNFMHGYDETIHSPLNMVTTKNFRGIEWIIKHDKWTMKQFDDCLFFAFEQQKTDVSFFLLKNVKNLSKRKLFIH